MNDEKFNIELETSKRCRRQLAAFKCIQIFRVEFQKFPLKVSFVCDKNADRMRISVWYNSLVTKMDPLRQNTRLTGDVDYHCVHPWLRKKVKNNSMISKLIRRIDAMN